MRKLLTPILMVCLVASCNPKREVHGQLNGTDETFSGKAKRFNDTSGVLILDSNYNVHCEGAFQNSLQKASPTRTAKGTLYCNDGRSGDFSFTHNRDGGQGEARLDGKQLPFSF